jgi:hypothetical protein
VSLAGPGNLVRRKQLLSSRAELERAQLALALHDIRAIVAPPRRPAEPKRRGRATAIATAVIGIGLPLLGGQRLARMIKAGSMLVAVWRIAHNWRRGAG